MATISGSDLLNFGEQYIGTPYAWGGNSLTSGVDCSGLVQQIYAHFGINLPRTTYDQIGQGKAVSMDKLQPGDLVFFSAGAGGSSPDHVAIYAGNGMMLESPKPGEAVRLTSFTQSYYADRFIGARRISDVTNAAGQGQFANTDTSGVAKNLDPQELAAEYGFAYSFLQSNKELKNIFSEAVSGTWTADRFVAALKGTNWWKDNSQNARQALITQSTDPATWNAQMNAASTQLQQLAAQMGAAIPPSKIQGMAKMVITAGYDEGQIKNMLGQYVNFQNNGTLGGAAGAFQHSLSQYAYSMGVPLSDQTVKNQAQMIARGLLTQDDAMAQVRTAAISSFPAYAEQINGGATMKDIAQPYAQVASQLLEQPDSNFNLQNPTIRQALNFKDQSGTPVGMTLSDFESSLRQSPQWLQTSNARDSMMGVARSVLANMGFSV